MAIVKSFCLFFPLPGILWICFCCLLFLLGFDHGFLCSNAVLFLLEARFNHSIWKLWKHLRAKMMCLSTQRIYSALVVPRPLEIPGCLNPIIGIKTIWSLVERMGAGRRIWKSHLLSLLNTRDQSKTSHPGPMDQHAAASALPRSSEPHPGESAACLAHPLWHHNPVQPYVENNPRMEALIPGLCDDKRIFFRMTGSKLWKENCKHLFTTSLEW